MPISKIVFAERSVFLLKYDKGNHYMLKRIMPFLLVIFLAILSGCDQDTDKKIDQTPQNLLLFVSHRYDSLLPELTTLQPLLKADYLSKYYLPWGNPEKIASFEFLKTKENIIINGYIQKPGWGENKKPLPKS